VSTAQGYVIQNLCCFLRCISTFKIPCTSLPKGSKSKNVVRDARSNEGMQVSRWGGVSGLELYPFCSHGAKWGVSGQRHTPVALTSGETHCTYPLYRLYRGQAGPQDRSGRVRQSSAQSGFEHQTFQAALSYTGHRKKRQCV